jgi:lipoprotein-releasing system ATP-binding protein
VADLAEAIISARSVGKTYRSGTADLVVFSELDLEVCRGERLAIIGESGAGKSTLLHLFGGLDRPSRGSILFSGVDIATYSDAGLADFRNREIGFVWQNHSLLPEFTAEENVMMPLLIRGATHAEASKAASARLNEVGLANRTTHRAGELSGGEQQRVALARALAGRPSVLLADEPTGNLDYRTGEMIMALLEELHTANGLTSIYVTHNLLFAERADRILKLEKGRLEPATRPSAVAAMESKPGQGEPAPPFTPAVRPFSAFLLNEGSNYV